MRLASIDVKALELEQMAITDEEILADLLYPAPAQAPARR